MIKDSIGYKSLIDYKSFIDNKSLVTQKVTIEVMISFNLEVFFVKIVIVESLILKTVEFNRDDMHIKMALIELGIMVLWQVAMEGFEI